MALSLKRTPTDDYFFATMLQRLSLTSLKLSGDYLAAATCRTLIQEYPKRSALRELELSSVALDENKLEFMRDFLHICTNLARLSFENNVNCSQNEGTASFFEHIQTFPDLRALCFNGFYLRPRSVLWVCWWINHTPSLKELFFDNTGITDDGASCLSVAIEQLGSLVTLSCRDCILTGKGASDLVNGIIKSRDNINPDFVLPFQLNLSANFIFIDFNDFVESCFCWSLDPFLHIQLTEVDISTDSLLYMCETFLNGGYGGKISIVKTLTLDEVHRTGLEPITRQGLRTVLVFV